MAWRVLINGAMIEVLNGVQSDGRELTATGIYRAETVIEKDLPRDYVKRYLENDPTVRSTVEFGRVDTVDEDGESRRVFVATGGPELGEVPASQSAPAASAGDGDALAKANAKVKELEDTASRFDSAYGSVKTELGDAQAKVAELESALAEKQTELEAAEELATQSLSYEDLSPDALEAEVKSKGLTPVGTGSNGNVLKKDNVKALEEARAAS